RILNGQCRRRARKKWGSGLFFWVFGCNNIIVYIIRGTLMERLAFISNVIPKDWDAAHRADKQRCPSARSSKTEFCHICPNFVQRHVTKVSVVKFENTVSYDFKPLFVTFVTSVTRCLA